jgi:hypothetical protein
VSKGNVYSEQNQANGDTVAIMLPYALYRFGGQCYLPYFAGVISPYRIIQADSVYKEGLLYTVDM